MDQELLNCLMNLMKWKRKNKMIIGIGTDMIEIQRVVKACEKEAFLLRVFSEAEQKLIEQDKKKAADNFSVKEAIVKMFGTGFRKVKPVEIEVLRDALGKPYVQLYGNAECLAKEQKITHVHVSITNTKEFSSAFVIGECRNEVCNK